ncbi:MAG: Alkaline phosphatase synthesis transcriptional regulatory protein SphR [Chroococcopsis gigantea SAG 12.99]|jgi:two-component system phosphate regulon response regulator PhoB|nr:response regulator transcription factor [Chlorogloea purpurea SAG 13.99]MDV3001338.1 Alkaline phosphatase synthesis transcriptional regulatory protein SphR [Chroococcopsis gigantea SAG 12.99]
MLSLEGHQLTASSELVTKHRILVVEDEEVIRNMVVMALEEEGYQVTATGDGRKGLELLQSNENNGSNPNFDLLVLDLMLPQVNGLDICRLLRYQSNIIPILILSAKASETDRVLGLEVGADDYLVKPFSMRELIARCRSLIRRQGFSSLSTAPVRKYRDVFLYSQECRVLVRGTEINLSPKEFRLLELFLSYPKRVWSREQLIEQIWGPDFLGDTKTVDVHIRWLREKLELDPSQPEYLITVRGFGYRFG